jgi:protein TonB
LASKQHTTAEQSYLDLVFESKNKTYGAYVLRRKHAAYTAIGFLISCVLILGAFGAYWWIEANERESAARKGAIKVEHRKVVGYSQLEAPPPIEAMQEPDEIPSQPKVVKERKVASKKFLPPKVKPDEEVVEVEPLPTQEELKYAKPGKKTEEGDSLGAATLEDYDDAAIELDVVPTNPIQGQEVEEAPEEAPPPKQEPPPEPEEGKVFQYVEDMATFPGGSKALMQYIANNIRYPAIARDNHIQGTVVLKLIIEADGSISEVELLRGIGGGCDREAIRLVKNMPKWIPAQQNDRNVRVQVILPIRFKLMID